MSDIKSELTGRLNEAKGRYEDARHEVELLAGLIAEFERLTAQDTRAFPAVPPTERRPLNPQNMVADGCGNCGQQISRNMPGDRWSHNDGCVECPIPGGTVAEPMTEAFPPVPNGPAPLDNVATVTVSDPQIMAEVTL